MNPSAADPGNRARPARRVLLLLGATTVAIALLAWSFRVLDPQSVASAFLIVWIPMTWLGTVSRVITPRLPAVLHRLRPVERDGHVYERLGVRVVKRLLRRGPIAAFNPKLHLPTEPTAERLAQLDQGMRDAEASHTILFLLTSGIAVYAVGRGWWASAGWITAFNLAMNGYPVMLQRYNRALLIRRFGSIAA